jgi:hypothetical protein
LSLFAIFALALRTSLCAGPHYLTRSTAGGFHIPSRISFFGQYSHMNRLKESFGAGSQFDSWSFLGDSFWIYGVSDPSALNFSLSRSPGEKYVSDSAV